MACRTESTVIDGHNVVVTQWPVTTALMMKMRGAKIVGPAMSALTHIDMENLTAMESVFADAIGRIFESDNSDPEKIVAFMEDVLTSGGIHIDGDALTKATYIELFSGDGMRLMYRVLYFVLKTNYGDLMGGRSLGGTLATKDKAIVKLDTPT